MPSENAMAGGSRKKQGRKCKCECGPDVQCERCGRWVYLEETPYDDLSSAEDGGAYVCRLCTKLSSLEERIATTSVVPESVEHLTADEWRQAAEALATRFEAQVEADCKVRESLEARIVEANSALEALREEVDTLRRAITRPSDLGQHNSQRGSSRTEGTASNADDGSNHSSGAEEIRGQVQREVAKVQPNATPSPEVKRTAESGQGVAPLTPTTVDGVQRTGGGSPSTLDSTITGSQGEQLGDPLANPRGCGSADVGPGANSSKGRRVTERGNIKDTNRKTATKGGGSGTNRKDRGSLNAGTQSGQKDAQRGTQSTSGSPRGKAQPVNPQCEVCVVGDSNAFRLGKALRQQVSKDTKVSVRSRHHATVEWVQLTLRQASEPTHQKRRVVVVHAGLADLLKGVEPEDIVRSLGEGAAPRALALVVCSVPEVRKRGKEVQARAMLLNAQLKKMCNSLKAAFVDISSLLEGERRMAQDGIHYLADTARQAAARVLQVSRPFLGGKHRTQDRHLKPDRSQPRGPHDERTVTGAQGTHPAPPLCRPTAPSTCDAAASTAIQWTDAQPNAWNKSLPPPPPFLPGAPQWPPLTPLTPSGSPPRLPPPGVPSLHPQEARLPITTPPPPWPRELQQVPAAHNAVGDMMRPPLPWSWDVQQATPDLHNTVGEMVRQHLLMATRLPQ